MLTFEFDTRELTAGLTRTALEAVPRAIANGLNDTVKDVQSTMRGDLPSRFTIRNPAFINRLVKINRDDFARNDKHEAIVRIQGPESVLGSDQRAAAVLTRHEEGGVHQQSPDSPFYVPAHALRPTEAAVIPRRQYPAALGITPRRTVEGGFSNPTRVGLSRGGFSIRGKSRTFTVPIGNPMGWTPGIYQREGGRGEDRNDIQLLWLFVQRVRLQPRLRFYATGNDIVQRRGAQHLVTAIERELLRILGRSHVYFGRG